MEIQALKKRQSQLEATLHLKQTELDTTAKQFQAQTQQKRKYRDEVDQ